MESDPHMDERVVDYCSSEFERDTLERSHVSGSVMK